MSEVNHTELKAKLWTTLEIKSSEELLSIAESFGKVIPSRKSSLNLIDTLTIKTHAEANPKSLSAIYGENEFPFHTDGAYLTTPPEFVLLRSRYEIMDCPTIFCKPIFTELQLKKMIKNVWLVNGGQGKFYASMVEKVYGDYRLRYDLACMRPGLRVFNESTEIMESIISNSEKIEINWKANQCIVFNNWKLLHSRADASDSKNRVLERAWISK